MKFLSAALLSLTLGAAGPQSDDPIDPTPRPSLDEYSLGKRGLALEGYDPVAYFDVGGGKPTKGDKRREVVHRGVRYRFSSDENRDLFLAAPARYEPAYGGWCAWAMADNDKTEINPRAFLIENGRLLVFYDGFFGDTRKKWLAKGGDALRPSADTSWMGMSKERAPRDVARFDLVQGVAFGGFDPVSAADGEPVAGSLELLVLHDGVAYTFATPENRARFEARPASFEVRYGGWCPTAIAEGRQVSPDPRFVLHTDDELLVFADEAARDAWTVGGDSVRAAADAGWARLLD